MKIKLSKRTKIGLLTITMIFVFLVQNHIIIDYVENNVGDSKYDEEMQTQLEKWAYGQQFLEGEERRDYYSEIGFFGSTYEDFTYFAIDKAEQSKSIHQIATTIIIFIFAWAINLLVYLWRYPD